MDRLEPKYVEMEREMAVRGTLEWIDNVERLYARAAEEARGYRARFMNAVADTATGTPGATSPVDVLSWLVNSTNTPAMNMRLDMAVTHGARLASAYDKVRALAKGD